MAESKGAKLTRISATVVSVGAALAMLTEFLGRTTALFAKWSDFQASLENFPPWVRWTALGLFMVLVPVAIYLRRGPRSRLVRPEAFTLDPSKPGHLKGRERDVVALRDKCVESRLVSLVGESGAGKSSLVKSGLIRDLQENTSLYPLYLESWGEDWETGPLESLARVSWETFSEEERTALGVSKPIVSTNVFNLLGEIRQKLGRTPLLIFDQLDDYQLQQRTKFLANNGFLKKPKTIADGNAFWAGVAKLLSSGVTHVLFVTRADMTAWLGCLRFVDPDVYMLSRLESQYIPSVLDELAPPNAVPPVVTDPDAGWERLKERLTIDLQQNGFALPAQLLVIIRGLACLPKQRLTIRDYKGGNGLAGLEAGYVEQAVGKCVQTQPKLSRERVRSMLMLLVDGSQREDKTLPKTLTEIATALDLGEDDASKVLDILERDGLVRMTAGDSAPAARDERWSLYHDYLAHAVREAELQAYRLGAFLVERHREHEKSVGSLDWWSTLLSPSEQLSLAYQRVRSRIKYGTHRNFALKSLIKSFTYLFIILIPIGAVLVMVRRAGIVDVEDNAALHIIEQVSEQRGSQRQFNDTLWNLSTKSSREKHAIFNEYLSKSQYLVYTSNGDILGHALFGLDPDDQDRSLARGNALIPSLQSQHLPIGKIIAMIRLGPYIYGSYESINPWLDRGIIELCDAKGSDRQALAMALADAVMTANPAVAERVAVHGVRCRFWRPG